MANTKTSKSKSKKKTIRFEPLTIHPTAITPVTTISSGRLFEDGGTIGDPEEPSAFLKISEETKVNPKWEGQFFNYDPSTKRVYKTMEDRVKNFQDKLFNKYNDVPEIDKIRTKFSLGGDIDPNTLYQELGQSSTDGAASVANSLGTTAANMAIPGLGTAISAVQNTVPQIVEGMSNNNSKSLQNKATAEGFVNPMKTLGKVWGSDDLNLGQKVLGTIAAPIGGHMVGKAASENYDNQMDMAMKRESYDDLASTIPNQFNFGGDINMAQMPEGMQANNPDSSSPRYNEYEGNTHAEGGIQVGPNAEVEDQEVRVEDYIFSNRLKNAASGKTFADEAKGIKKKYSGRGDYDPATNRAMNKELERLRQANEVERKLKEAEEAALAEQATMEMDSAIGREGINPELPPQGNPEELEATSQMAEQMGEEMGQEQFKYGGNMKYPEGGELPSDDEKLRQRRAIAKYVKDNYGNRPPTKGLEKKVTAESDPETYAKLKQMELADVRNKEFMIGDTTVDPRGFNAYVSGLNPTFYIGEDGNLDYRQSHYPEVGEDYISSLTDFKETLGTPKTKTPNPGYNTTTRNVAPTSQEIVEIPQTIGNIQHSVKRVRQSGAGKVFDEATGSMVPSKFFLGGELPDFNMEGSGTASNILSSEEPYIPMGGQGYRGEVLDGKGGDNSLMEKAQAFLGKPENMGLLASNLGPMFNLAQASNVETSRVPRVDDLSKLDLSNARLGVQRQDASDRETLTKNIRQTSPGGAGQALAAQAGGNASIADRSINSFLQLYRQEAETNTGLENQQKFMDQQAAAQEADANERNRANELTIKSAALTDMGTNTQGFIRDKSLMAENKIQNEEQMQLINQLFPNYQFLPEDEKAKIRKFVVQYNSPAGNAPN